MRLRTALVVLTLGLALTSCASKDDSAEPVAEGAPSTLRVVDPYNLYTHCGIREAKVGQSFYRATPEKDDGSGNPPDGWGNPYQEGTMTLYDDGTARFTAPGGFEANFQIRPGATDWQMICS